MKPWLTATFVTRIVLSSNQHGHPWVTAILNDGTKVYDHDEDGKAHTEGGCQSFFRNLEFPTYVRISYYKELKTIKVDVDTKEDDGFSDCFTVHNVDLPSGYFFGATASTGDLADNHDIISMKVSTPAKPSEELVQAAVQDRLKHSKDIGSLAAAAQMAQRHKMDTKKIVTNHAENHPEELNNLRAMTPSESSNLLWWIVVVFVVVGGIGGVAYMVMKKEQDTKRFKY